ncbi:MAG: UDP-N-acetylglucosamine 2-epimerase [Candidatus Gracilibacteria bacterium]|nr:UDP-N-acetylglucosamine 2-epimerase [Candidatus Gracilibacteria bacterium]
MQTINKEDNSVYIRPNFWFDIQNSVQKYAHIIMIATKPDIIKQAPLYLELKSRGELVILVHTGQHYDYNLSKGVLGEFGMEVDVNLNIFGPIHKKFSLVIDRLGDFLVELSGEYKKIPVPYVHGDTLTATTADKAAFLNKFAVVHVEAGIRTFTPNKEFYHKLFKDFEDGIFNWEKYYKKLQEFDLYETGSIEPYPEQFDTRGIEASTGLFAVPVDLYRKTLRNEGFPKEHIKVVGNTVADAIEISKQKVKDSKAFEAYPNMKGKPFIFITIHRRENTEKKERFLIIYNAIKKLIEDGVNVCFLGLYASEFAIDNYGLRDDIENLRKKYKENFAYGPALAHHSEVIDMISKAGAVVTDSGSMQEEANIVGVPCVTVRFGSDRTETILDGTNIIAPPINSKLIVEIVKGAISNKSMIKKEHLYGKNVSKKIVDEVLEMLKKDGKLFKFDDERLDLEQFFNHKI